MDINIDISMDIIYIDVDINMSKDMDINMDMDISKDIPHCCHGNERPPETFPRSLEEGRWKFLWVPIGVLSRRF